MTVEVQEHLASVQSPFQKIDVYDSEVFGKMLLLDGHIQLTTFDERAYHESLVWVPLLNITQPKRALVVGGGDGGVLREICRCQSIEAIDMVEIDQAVVEVSKQHLPTVSAGAFDDPRVNLVVGDAFEYCKGEHEPYDLVVVDCTDVYEDEEGELSEMLFTSAFYADVLRLLKPDGFVVTQADNPVFCPYSRDEVLGLFGQVFPVTGSYWGLVPSFGGVSAYVWGSRQATVRPESEVPSGMGLVYLNDANYSSALLPLVF